MRLANKVAVVTGGASGMGKASVLRFLKEGAQVVVADFNETTGKETIADVSERGFKNRVRFVKVDVAKESDIIAMLECARDNFGGLDILLNNAGVGGAIGPLTETTVGAWDYTMNVMARGVFLGTKHAARHLKEQGRGGAIINTASIAGLTGDGGPLVYSAAKAAVISLTRSAAVELAADRIRVNAICPGCIVTPMVSQDGTEVTKAAFSKMQPWPEYGNADDIAGAALFLASGDSRFITGEYIVVDGGLTAAGPELSRKLPNTSARDAKVTGIAKGNTGEAHEFRSLHVRDY